MSTPGIGEPNRGSASEESENDRVGEEEKLLARWKLAEGDDEREEAFRAIYARYYLSLRRFFARRGFAPQEAEDLGQETFLRIFDGLERFRGESRFEIWIYRIAANVYRNTLRSQSASKREGSEVLFDSEREPAEDAAWGESGRSEPLEQALLHERQTLVASAIGTLPPRMRRCLLLGVEGLEYREIAEILRLSINTVKAHLHQARQELQGKLREDFPDIDL